MDNGLDARFVQLQIFPAFPERDITGDIYGDFVGIYLTFGKRRPQ